MPGVDLNTRDCDGHKLRGELDLAITRLIDAFSVYASVAEAATAHVDSRHPEGTR
jgi:hypothetical protein